MRLGVPGEALVPVHGLPCPDAEDRDRLEAFDAVRLFAARNRNKSLIHLGLIPKNFCPQPS